MTQLSPKTKKALIRASYTFYVPTLTPGKRYKVSVSHHIEGHWVKPLKSPLYGLYKVIATGRIRVKPSRAYTLSKAKHKFGALLKYPEYNLDIVEDTNLG